MKIKNSQVVKFFNGVESINEKRLPIKIGYAITKNLKTLEPVAAAYEEERKKLISKFAELDEKGNPKTTEDSRHIFKDYIQFEDGMHELMEIENEIELQPIPLAELEKCDSEKFDSLSVQDITFLDFMTESE